MEQSLEILSFDEALKILPGFTKWGLYNMIRRRQIPFRKRGRKILFLKTELIQWAEKLPGVTVEVALKGSGDDEYDARIIQGPQDGIVFKQEV